MRIESIGALHEQLNGNIFNQQINFKKYVTDVANNIIECFSNGKQVVTHLDIEEMAISPDKNFPLALIFNEWITNSLKYAIPKNNALALYLNIHRKNGHISIEYHDNGVTNAYSSKDKGLGQEIITLLCAQLKARLQTSQENPYHYTLTIPNG